MLEYHTQITNVYICMCVYLYIYTHFLSVYSCVCDCQTMWFINYRCSFSTIGCLSKCQYFSNFYYCNFWSLHTISLFRLVYIRYMVVNIKFMKTIFKVILVCLVSFIALSGDAWLRRCQTETAVNFRIFAKVPDFSLTLHLHQ